MTLAVMAAGVFALGRRWVARNPASEAVFA